jgi:SulP family sulfate permease
MAGGNRASQNRRHLVPIVRWLRSYDRRWPRADLIAGVAVAAALLRRDGVIGRIGPERIHGNVYRDAEAEIAHAKGGAAPRIVDDAATRRA